MKQLSEGEYAGKREELAQRPGILRNNIEDSVIERSGLIMEP